MAMNEQETTAFVRKLMTAFAERTGLVGGQAPTRYLWTDAFAVCNLLELERRTGDGTYRELALRLVEGLTGPEIAARTGLTPGSVRVNLCRGMKLLRERLQEKEVGR